MLGGLSVRTIENYIRAKELVGRKVGKRSLVTVASLQAFARRDHASPRAARNGGGATTDPSEKYL
jgi:hypothetical protein